MIELQGKFNKSKVYTDLIDSATTGQIISLCNVEAFKDSQIRIMPDCHAGKGCTVGTTMTIHNAVTPNLVGVDIGCGMLAIKLKEKRIDLPAFDSVVRKFVPCGAGVHDSPRMAGPDLENLRCYGKARIREMLAYCSIGTLGGGNHFIELDKDSNEDIWLVIHTGSRHLGIEVCDYYQKQAYLDLKFKANKGNLQTKTEALIEQLKSEGKHKEISKRVKEFKSGYTEIEPGVH